MNGWTNFSTWQVSTRLQNDETSYDLMREAAKNGLTDFIITGKFLTGMASAPINWEEIFEAFLE